MTFLPRNQVRFYHPDGTYHDKLVSDATLDLLTATHDTADNSCYANSPGVPFSCTRPDKHPGTLHIAHGLEDTSPVCACWLG